MEEKLLNIKETMCGYPIKDLRWLPVDNIIVGMVKDPLFGKDNLHDGFVCVQWNKQGKPLKLHKGRNEISLNI